MCTVVWARLGSGKWLDEKLELKSVTHRYGLLYRYGLVTSFRILATGLYLTAPVTNKYCSSLPPV